jgi:hypothetical protein
VTEEQIQKENEAFKFVFDADEAVIFDSVLIFKERQQKSTVYSEKMQIQAITRSKVREGNIDHASLSE